MRRVDTPVCRSTDRPINLPTAMDLFCGCGGLSLGLMQAGIKVVAGVDNDPAAITVYKANMPEVGYIGLRDMTTLNPAELASEIGTDSVYVIVGGPPCQGFSNVRQVDGANNGPRLIHDPRRSLYYDFFKFVSFFKPRIFVMENVPGIRSAENGRHFEAIGINAELIGYRTEAMILDAADFGVPQRRKRQFIWGLRTEQVEPKIENLLLNLKNGRVTLGEAIGDLPRLRAGKGEEEMDYDLNLRNRHIAKYGDNYLVNVLEIGKTDRLTSHAARPHSERDIRDFGRLLEGENSAQAMRRGVVFEFPYRKDIFPDRYKRQHNKKPSSTILAHLSKDGLMFIHPTQNRTLTVREAARLQSFPDWFVFPVPRTHQYRMIGNAVPPLLARAIGQVTS